MKRRKPNLNEAVREAEELGISYGTYIGYRDTGYLETYKRIHEREVKEKQEAANVVESYIGGGKDKCRSGMAHFYSSDKRTRSGYKKREGDK